jgi:hypothetical protein
VKKHTGMAVRSRLIVVRFTAQARASRLRAACAGKHVFLVLIVLRVPLRSMRELRVPSEQYSVTHLIICTDKPTTGYFDS